MSTPSAVEALLPKPSPAMVVDSFRLVVTSVNEWVTVVAQEQTRRQEIRAWEKSQLEIIRVQRDFLLTALDKTFDERREKLPEALRPAGRGSGLGPRRRCRAGVGPSRRDHGPRQDEPVQGSEESHTCCPGVPEERTGDRALALVQATGDPAA